MQLASAPSLPLPYTGRRCESCGDGFFGDPLGLSGAPRPCRQCQCNGNVDLNAVGNCDPHSGRCLRCLYNTTGTHCELCQEGFYGSALATRPADKCAREYPKSQTHGVKRGNLCPQPSFRTQTGELRANKPAGPSAWLGSLRQVSCLLCSLKGTGICSSPRPLQS